MLVDDHRIGELGFTVVEMVIALAMSAVLLAVAYGGYREFNEAMVAKNAINVVSSDLSLTRSYAIRRRSNVSVVGNEAGLSYRIRAADGTILATRDFGTDSGLPLDALDIQTSGDSLTFNSRGLLVGMAGTQVTISKLGRDRTLQVNALGRVDIQPR